MNYENTFATSRPAESLRKLAEKFAELNFRIEECHPHFLSVTGPGLNSTKENPLLGISQAEIRVEGGSLYVEARLTEAARLMRRVIAWVFGPLLVVAIVLSALLPDGFIKGEWMWVYVLALTAVIGGNLSLWLFLLPVIGRFHRRRTAAALENLFLNLEKL